MSKKHDIVNKILNEPYWKELFKEEYYEEFQGKLISKIHKAHLWFFGKAIEKTTKHEFAKEMLKKLEEVEELIKFELYNNGWDDEDVEEFLDNTVRKVMQQTKCAFIDEVKGGD